MSGWAHATSPLITRVIFHCTDSNDAVDQATQNFNEIVTIFKEYPGCKLTFIETAPYSIYEWNKYFKHSDPNQLKNEDNILIRQVLKLSANIQEINSGNTLAYPGQRSKP